MTATFTNEYGTVYIDDTVIANIACKAAMESYGLAGLAAKNTKDGLYEILGIENMTKGVRVIPTGPKSINIEILAIIRFGVRISMVAQNVIEKVKYSVESNTGLEVSSVDLIIQDIHF